MSSQNDYRKLNNVKETHSRVACPMG